MKCPVIPHLLSHQVRSQGSPSEQCKPRKFRADPPLGPLDSPCWKSPPGPCCSVPVAAESAPRPWPETRVLWLAPKRSKRARGRDNSIPSTGVV